MATKQLFQHQLRGLQDQTKQTFPTFSSNIVDFTTNPSNFIPQPVIESQFFNNKGYEDNFKRRMDLINFNDNYEKKDDLSKLDELISKFADDQNW